MVQKENVNDNEWLWAFQGENSDFCSAIFSKREKAELWIAKYSLSGILTRMPVDISVYDWTIEKDFFIPKKDFQKESNFIQRFSSAYLEHYHYENGVNKTQ